MKHFQVPSEITIKPWIAQVIEQPNVKPEKMSFLKFATFIWLEDSRPYASDDGRGFSVVKQRRWIKVIDKFEAAKPGDWISLDDQDYVALKAVVEAPNRLFPSTATMMSCLPFSEVVLTAVDELPAVVNGAQASA
jgi:hypothetical protein